MMFVKTVLSKDAEKWEETLVNLDHVAVIWDYPNIAPELRKPGFENVSWISFDDGSGLYCQQSIQEWNLLLGGSTDDETPAEEDGGTEEEPE